MGGGEEDGGCSIYSHKHRGRQKWRCSKSTSIEPKDLAAVIKNLEKSKLISIEQRTRGCLDSADTYQDRYICLAYPKPTRLALAQDRTLMKYKLIIGRQLGRKLDKFSF